MRLRSKPAYNIAGASLRLVEDAWSMHSREAIFIAFLEGHSPFTYGSDVGVLRWGGRSIRWVQTSSR